MRQRGGADDEAQGRSVPGDPWRRRRGCKRGNVAAEPWVASNAGSLQTAASLAGASGYGDASNAFGVERNEFRSTTPGYRPRAGGTPGFGIQRLQHTIGGPYTTEQSECRLLHFPAQTLPPPRCPDRIAVRCGSAHNTFSRGIDDRRSLPAAFHVDFTAAAPCWTGSQNGRLRVPVCGQLRKLRGGGVINRPFL
jgi:hypothetical protein